jgi:hypothetical protein
LIGGGIVKLLHRAQQPEWGVINVYSVCEALSEVHTPAHTSAHLKLVTALALLLVGVRIH